MSTYSVAFSINSSTASPPLDSVLAVRAGSYELRLVEFSVTSSKTDPYYVYLIRYDSSALTGGSAVPITPLRQGAPAASATSRGGYLGSGSNINPSGTAQYINYTMLSPGGSVTADASTGYNPIYKTTGTSTSFSPPLPITVKPGGILVVLGWPITCTIFFEELRLAGSY